METNKNGSTLAIVFLSVGFILYVLADSGLFSNWSEKFSLNNKNKFMSADLHLKQLEDQLDELKKQAHLKQNKADEINREMANIQKLILAESKDVEKLKLELNQLNQEKEKIAQQLASQKQTQSELENRAAKARTPSSSNLATFRNWNSWSQMVSNIGLEVEPIQLNQRNHLKVSGFETLYNSQNYLLGRGLRFAQSLASIYQNTMDPKIEVQYRSDSQLSLERAIVLKNYVRELLEGTDPLQLKAITNSEDLVDGQLNILVGLGEVE